MDILNEWLRMCGCYHWSQSAVLTEVQCGPELGAMAGLMLDITVERQCSF